MLSGHGFDRKGSGTIWSIPKVKGSSTLQILTLLSLLRERLRGVIDDRWTMVFWVCDAHWNVDNLVVVVLSDYNHG